MNPTHHIGRSGARGRRIAALMVLALMGVTACAALALAQSSTPAPARPRAANQPNGARNGNPRSYVPADSGPSAEALRVLETIPEPVAAADRIAAPADSAARDTARRAPADSARARADSASAAADTSDADANGAAPVPSPTQPMGDTTRTVPSYSEPATSAPATPVGATPAAPPPTKPAPAATPDTCWAVQIASPTEKARAEKLREAAESVLVVRMMVEPGTNRFGVRTSDCLSGAAADSLRKRALASGFKDAFRVKYVRGKAAK